MYRKTLNILAGLGLAVFLPFVVLAEEAQAEVLIILPQKGPMAVAANSVRDGIQAAYYAGNYKPALRFVDNSQRSINDILKTEVKKSTQLIIGPLAREEVEALVQARPAVKTLALNQVYKTQSNIWQFALSPDEDALAITKRIQADGVDQLIVLTQDSRSSSTKRFRDAMNRIWGGKLVDNNNMPRKLMPEQGILLLGDYDWISQLKKLPSEKIYTVPLAIKENASLPVGLQFCDIPALYKADWPELLKAYQEKPTSVPYQRLLAFGGDTWNIASMILSNMLNGNQSQTMNGRTGTIRIVKNTIDRYPQCMKVESTGLSFN
jgi:outer membrane PBP1 activator LpoA protein